MGGGLRGGVQSCYCLPSVNTTHHTTSTMADTEPTTVEEVQVSRTHFTRVKLSLHIRQQMLSVKTEIWNFQLQHLNI